jgi:hypothetical protein
MRHTHAQAAFLLPGITEEEAQALLEADPSRTISENAQAKLRLVESVLKEDLLRVAKLHFKDGADAAKKKRKRTTMDALRVSMPKGLNRLDGGRYHLLVPARHQAGRTEEHCEAFYLLSKEVQVMLMALVSSAEKRIDRFLPKKSQWRLGYYALIFTFAGGRAQAIHVDVPAGCWQFALNCCMNTEPTWMYLGRPLSAGDLREEFHDVPNITKSAVAGQFATLMQPRHKLMENVGRPLQLANSGWQLGDVLALKGGWPHAGPAYNGYRCVLFMVATPSTCDSYDEDEQHTPWTCLETLAREKNTFTKAERAAIKMRFAKACVEWHDFEPWARWEDSNVHFSKARMHACIAPLYTHT